MLKRHEVQVLLRAGHGPREVAGLTGVPERTVRRIAAEAPVDNPDNEGARKTRRIGRPSSVEHFRKLIAELVAEKPPLLSVEILRRVRLAGYKGGKSALYGLAVSLRPSESKFEAHFDGLPGEFSQHDFGHVDVKFLNGSIKRVHFFASRMKYSRWIEVTLVENENAETLVRTLVDHFAAIGGIPLLAVFDRPKTVAIAWKHNGEITQWNSTFAYAMLELGLGAEVCWPHSPQQKGAVECLVKWVKGSFFKQRRFQDHADLVDQLREWAHETNTTRPSSATNVIPAVRLREETPRLRPLKVQPENLALRLPVSVGPTAKVLYLTNTYAMPPESIGMPATLFLYRDRVRIVAGRYTREHPRLFGEHLDSSDSEDRAAHVAAVSGKRGKRYLKRQHLLQTGPAALHFLTELTHRRPWNWNDQIDRLHDLLQEHGPERLAIAFQHALVRQAYGAEYIVQILDNENQQTLFDEKETQS